MKYFFLFIFLLHLLDFRVSAQGTENYYKTMRVLSLYHARFSAHTHNDYLIKAIGPRSVDFSEVCLFFEEEENIQDLVMRKGDLRLNHLYLAATPLAPPTKEQIFANSLAMFMAIEEMLRFRVGSVYYKRDRGVSAIIKYFHYPVDSKTERDTLTTAKNMELMSKLTDALNENMERATIKRQYPIKPFGAWVFETDGEDKKSVDAEQIIKNTLALDFYIEEENEEEEWLDQEAREEDLSSRSENEEISSTGGGEDLAEISSARDKRTIRRSRSGLDEPSSSREPDEEQQKEVTHVYGPSNTEQVRKKRELRRAFLNSLKTIREKHANPLQEAEDKFFYRHLWREILTVYGSYYRQVKDYFNYVMFEIVDTSTADADKYVPKFEESKAVWENVFDLLTLATSKYETDKSKTEQVLKSNPITVLEEIEKIKYAARGFDKEHLNDENQIKKGWKLGYINPEKNAVPADLQVLYAK